jgi:bifunctional non-homologous end joining protein LigD
MPTLVKPMLATLGDPPHGPGWGWEWKWDGARTVAYLDGRDGLRLRSRNDLDVTGSYPELASLAGVDQPMVLDGEIVALDTSGAPSFGRLQRRMHVRAPNATMLRTVPVRYYIFDLLWSAGEDLTGQPYTVRRSQLEQLELPRTTGAVAAVPDALFGDVDPADLLRAASDNGLEGVVARRLTSRYRPGRRSRDWVKVPLVRTQEFVVVGWKPGAGRRHGMRVAAAWRTQLARRASVRGAGRHRAYRRDAARPARPTAIVGPPGPTAGRAGAPRTRRPRTLGGTRSRRRSRLPGNRS